MRVAVLGGGFQGCCAALALTSRGVKVTMFDCNPALMTRAAIASEGKVHLGYVYGGDSTLATARTMIREHYRLPRC
jgi:glycine/D-amino acid oxidase-like deaminating enzyme